MQLKAFLLAFTLAWPCFASVVNLNIYTDSTAGKDTVSSAVVEDNQKALVLAEPSTPRWRRRDKNHLVELNPNAKTGLLETAYEEGLTSALGPRFVNVFLEAADAERNGSHIDASCNPFKCGTTVIKLAPCIAAAIACRCVTPLTACGGVNLNKLCSCVGCLPGPIKNLIAKFGICSGKLEDMPGGHTTENDESDYPEFVAFSTRSSNLLAYRGDLPLSTLAEAKTLAATGLCPGSPCGDCKCCLGACIPDGDQCLGVCLPVPNALSTDHVEL